MISPRCQAAYAAIGSEVPPRTVEASPCETACARHEGWRPLHGERARVAGPTRVSRRLNAATAMDRECRGRYPQATRYVARRRTSIDTKSPVDGGRRLGERPRCDYVVACPQRGLASPFAVSTAFKNGSSQPARETFEPRQTTHRTHLCNRVRLT